MSFKNIGIGMMLAAGMATGVAASQSATRTLIGCLIRGPVNNTTSSTVVPPGNPPPPPMYKLTRIDAHALSTALPEQARREMGKETPTVTEVGLRANTATNLAEHLDQRVEITGKFVAGKPDGTAATVSRGTKTTTVPGTAGIPDVPSFQVTSVRMLAASCQ